MKKNTTLQILLSAYACEPGAGSEYGVGWNVAVNLARFHHVYVLTRSRCRQKIEKELMVNPNSNLHFIFYDVPKLFYYKNEMGSKWGEQYNYLLWQLSVKNKVKKENKKIKFDLFHHITFNQYRTPSPGLFLDIPFVFGPIGGAETIAKCFYQDLEKSSFKKEEIRRKGIDFKLFGFWFKKNKNTYVLASTKENENRLKPYIQDSKICTLPAIGFDPKDFEGLSFEVNENDEFLLIYAGKLYDWKGVHIFLKAIKNAFTDNHIQNFKVKLIGLRFESEQAIVNSWVSELELLNYVEIIPFLERKNLLQLLASCNLFVYPAFRDSGSMAILEASVLACPTICFDAGGQDAFANNSILKVEVMDTYDETLKSFSNKILWAYNNPSIVNEIGENAKKYVFDNLTWDKKVNDFIEIYKQII